MSRSVDNIAALKYVVSAMKNDEEFNGIEEKNISKYAVLAMAADFAYMEQANVDDGGVYDDDDAYDYIMDILAENKDNETSALISLIVRGYLKYFDEFLEKNNLIDWE